MGRTVHVVPAEGGTWQVVDLQRRISTFPNRALAVEQAKALAEAHQPSQVVLFDKTGHLAPVAHYQLPEYRIEDSSAGSLIEATVKFLVIGGLVAAGVAVLQEVVDSIASDLKRGTAKSTKSSPKKRRRRLA